MDPAYKNTTKVIAVSSDCSSCEMQKEWFSFQLHRYKQGKFDSHGRLTN